VLEYFRRAVDGFAEKFGVLEYLLPFVYFAVILLQLFFPPAEVEKYRYAILGIMFVVFLANILIAAGRQTLARDPKFFISIPCTRHQLKDYHDLLEEILPGQGPTWATMQDILQKNNYSLLIIRDFREIVVGGLELWGMKSQVFEDYIAGRLTDNDLRPGQIATLEDIAKDKRIYAAITIKKNLTRNQSNTIKGYLFAAAGEIVDRVYFREHGLEKLSVYAIGATRPGIVLLKSLRFRPIGDRRSRKDSCQLYVLEVDSDMLNEFRMDNPIIPMRLACDIHRELVS